MPKTGGSSLKNQIASLFDENEVYFDYEEDPANPISPIQLNPHHYQNRTPPTKGSRFIYGHFSSSKYRNISDAFRMTFLRNPVDNIISIYNFWMIHKCEQWDNPLFKYVVNNNLSLLDFARLPLIKKLYSKVYFEEIDIKKFQFVGDFSDYNNEIQRLSKLLDIQFLNDININVTSEIKPQNEFNLVSIDSLELQDIVTLKNILKDDIEFYEKYAGK